MACYFFHYQKRDTRVHDDDGEEFQSTAEAVSHARQVAHELARNRPLSGLKGCAIVIEDKDRQEIFVLPLEEFSANASWPIGMQPPLH